jgi:hypothetical protein
MYKIVSTKDFPGARFEEEIIRLRHSGWKLYGDPFRQDQYANMAQALTKDK